jgi:hypothetical protein
MGQLFGLLWKWPLQWQTRYITLLSEVCHVKIRWMMLTGGVQETTSASAFQASSETVA